MSLKASFATEGTYTPDALVAGNAHLLVARTIKIATGQNLKRGSVLGKVTSANSATTPAGAQANDGVVVFGTITPDATAQDGVYTVTVTAAKDGATGAKFTVASPGGQTATGTMGVAFAALGLGFTITDGLTTDASAVGDVYTFTVTAANGEYKLSASASNDGSQTPDLILAEDVDATAADKPALAYSRGDFNANAITLGAGHTVASITEGLRAKGIALLPAVSA
ncbi:MAG: head decoration protein [Giesbergeria sp.]|jgi:hypothetical protein|nr:head decoration protein [Giesbergeria sp.]